MYACFVVGLLVVVEIAGAHENLQGGMDADGEMVEAQAELLDVELAVDAIAVAGSNLVVVGQMFIHLFNIFARGEGVVDALRQLAVVAAVEEQNGSGRLTVASGTASLLEVSLEGVGTVVVDDQSDVGLVDAHAEGVGGYHDARAVVLPVALAAVLVSMVESGMVECRRESCIGEVFGNLAGMTPAAHIDDGRAWCAVEQPKQFAVFVGGVLNKVGQVLALEGHAKHGKAVFPCVASGFPGCACGFGGTESRGQLGADVVYDLWRGGSRQCQHGDIRMDVADVGNFEIGRSEVVAPLRDAVCLVDSDEAHLHVAQLGLKQAAAQAFGRDI